MMKHFHLVVVAVVALASAFPLSVRAQDAVTPKQVREALDKAVAYLRTTGAFNARAPYGIGMNALAILAMLHAGVPPSDPDVVRAAEMCAAPANWNANTYHVGCVAAALAAVDGKKYRAVIQKCATWLIEAQNKDGGWRYQSSAAIPDAMRRAREAWEKQAAVNPRLRRVQPNWAAQGVQQSDHSCTQFGLLGLRAAEDCGIPIPDATWKTAEKYLVDSQAKDGGWTYTLGPQTYGSMTAAGLGSLYLCGMKLHQRAEKCGEYEENTRIAAGLNWLANHYSVTQNPGRGGQYFGYYLYALERITAFSGRRLIGQHDWYAEGAAHLVRAQQPNGSWQPRVQLGGPADLDSIFFLLFLGKASAQVLIQKLDYGPGWNTDYYDADNFAARVSQELDLKCTWQVVGLDDPLDAWLQAPILYVTGHGRFELTPELRQKVRDFCDRGGTIVADDCCGNETFDQSFRAEMARVFPTVPLEPIPAEHPVYQAPHKITDKRLRVWLGITAGCRTAVLYSPVDLSCAWDGNIHDVEHHPISETDAFRLAVDVAAYAIGYRPLKDKLDEVKAEPRPDIQDDGRVARGALVFAQLKHEGDWNPDPAAARSILRLYAQDTGARVNMTRADLDPSDPNLYKYPFLYMTGHKEFTYTEAQIKSLREYFDRGGFMFADACCGRPEFDKAFRALVKQIFPQKNLELLPLDHRIFHIKYDINTVRYRPILMKELPEAERQKPRLEAIVVDGRAVLVYSPFDFGCAFEGFPCATCRGLELESAQPLLSNILLYGMTE